MNHVMPVYNRLPIALTHGKGVFVYDENNNEYLDALSGIGVTSLGHCHPAVVEAIEEQAHKIIHTSNIFQIPEMEKLADELTQITGMENIFFSNSGAEANEAAIKLARLYGHQKDIEIPHIIVVEKGFHGRTLANISASGNRKIQAGFEPLVQGFFRAPYNDIAAIKNIATHHHDIVAIWVEPILGNAGIQIPDSNYLAELRKICDENGWLLMLDEIQTGLCRTGKFYAYQHQDIVPDILTSAKALGNGIPIGACLASGAAAGLFQPGKHGSTFGGNPFACHVARAVIKTMQQEEIAANAAKVGSYLLHQLQERFANIENVKAIRGKGLMIGIELDRPCREVYHHALKQNLIFSVTAQKVIRLLPPLIYSNENADMLVDRLEKTLQSYLGSN